MVIPAAAAVALMIAFVLPVVMLWIASAIVVISDLGINHNVMWGKGWRHNFWRWDQISSCSIINETHQGHRYRVLEVNLVDGGRLVFAIAPQVEDQTVRSAIQDRGHSLASN